MTDDPHGSPVFSKLTFRVLLLISQAHMASSSSVTPSIALQRFAVPAEPDSCLAEVVRVENVKDIDGADRIQRYLVKGWQCVAQKDAFKAGDLVIYVRIGAVLDPANPDWAFLEGKPLKTKKLRGALSQGLIGPLSWLGSDDQQWTEGRDVTALMRVRKFVETEESTAIAGGSKPRPSWIPKTDAERVQNITRAEWRDLLGQTAYPTRKDDGTSATYYWKSDTGFGICSRNYEVDPAEAKGVEHYLAMADKYQLRSGLKALGRDIAIQGEIVGPGVNGNRLLQKELEYHVFDIFDVAEQHYLVPTEVIELTARLGVPRVPSFAATVLDETRTNAQFWLTESERVEYAPHVPAEGLVFRVIQGNRQQRFKAVSNSFLLKHGL
jgi:RNA ligase (TIGR02306 family)